MNASVNNLDGHQRLNQGLALGAGPLSPDVALHCEQLGRVIR